MRQNTYKILLMFMFSFLLVGCDQIVKTQEQEQEEEQCNAITQKGIRCKLKPVEGSKYCSKHKRSSKTTKNKTRSATKQKITKCKAKTNDGSRCSRNATKYGYCSQHYKTKKK